MDFVLIENTPGYLPESEPMHFDEWEEARQAALDLIQEMKDEGWTLISLVEAVGGTCWLTAELTMGWTSRIIEVMEENQ